MVVTPRKNPGRAMPSGRSSKPTGSTYILVAAGEAVGGAGDGGNITHHRKGNSGLAGPCFSADLFVRTSLKERK